MKVLSSFFLIFILCFSCGYAEIASPADKTNNLLPSEEVFVKADGAQLFCRVFGQGKPIVVIHGGPGLTQDYLLPPMARLKENNRVIFYDQRACGRSTGEINAGSIRIETFMDDLEAIRKAFGYAKITVLGHSWGAFLAMEYAIAHPESIEKMILLSSCPASSEDFSLFMDEWVKRTAPYQDELKAMRESKEFIAGDPAMTEKYYRLLYRAYCYNPEKANLLNVYMSQKACINGEKVEEIFMQNLFVKPFNLHDQLKKVRIPTLIIHGDADIIPPATAQKIHESIAGSKYILIKNCGHFPHVETPDELFNDLK